MITTNGVRDLAGYFLTIRSFTFRAPHNLTGEKISHFTNEYFVGGVIALCEFFSCFNW